MGVTISTFDLIKDAEAPEVGTALESNAVERSFQAVVEGTGAVTAEFEIQGSLDNENFETIGTITLSDTDSAHDGFSMALPWKYIRGELVSISGSDAVANLKMGVAS